MSATARRSDSESSALTAIRPVVRSAVAGGEVALPLEDVAITRSLWRALDLADPLSLSRAARRSRSSSSGGPERSVRCHKGDSPVRGYLRLLLRLRPGQ